MSHRRRGGDFSHLLESFCNTTDCGPDLNMQKRDESPCRDNISEGTSNDDRIFSTNTSHGNDDSETCSYKSTILAGRAADVESRESTENSYRTACSDDPANHPISIDGSVNSCRSEVPSLMNRAIDNRFVAQSDLDLSQISGETGTSDEFNRNIETSDKSSLNTRDTNYNIRNRVEVPTSSVSNAKRLEMNSPICRKMAGTTTHKDSSAVMFKRLSQEFISSPHRFTERLVTIIDESESGYDNGDNTGVDLSRMTKEFRKMCKFIQDESMPEHMNSTLGISTQFVDNKFVNIDRPDTIEESPNEVSSTNDVETPENKDICRKIYRKTPLNLFKKNLRENCEIGSPGSPNSTRTFVYLEKYLNEQPASPLAGSSRELISKTSTSDISEQLRDKIKLVQKSKEQLASLDDTNSPEFETFDSHPAHGTQKREICDLNIPYLDNDDSLIDDGPINEDELSISLRLELEKQRERCFETAREIQKIEEDAKASNEDYPKVLERYGIDPEIECRKTINSLLAYQNCWTKIRQKNNSKKNDLSSYDSGIDTRSISRTFQASSKKSCSNEKSMKISGINNRLYDISSKYSKSETITPLRSNGARSRLELGTKRNEIKAQTPRSMLSKNSKTLFANIRKSPAKLCPTAKSLARSRSRSAEKPLEARYGQSKLEIVRTPETNRLNENRKNLAVPKLVVGQTDISDQNSTPRAFNDKKLNADTITARTTPGSGKSSCSRYLPVSPGVSPSSGRWNKDRATKMSNVGRTESPASNKSTKVTRNRFFVTPGKTVPVKSTKRRSKTFFPSMDADIQQEGAQRIMKSLHAPGIYRKGFNCTVISPVSMYIRGTDMNLVQNLQVRSNDMLLTPTKTPTSEGKLKFNLAATPTTHRDSRQKKCFFTRQEDVESQSDDNDENKEEPDFVLPKAKYEPPTRVHTINADPKNIGGARTRGLLQSMQNRVVIRHKEKIFGRHEEHEESDIDTVNMSIHVQKSAEKTNYTNRWK